MKKPTVAFVGTGGAARGIAHLGVLRACEELGIRPTIFVGASAGAIVAATYGQGIPLDVLLDGYRLPWKRRHDGPRFHMSTFFGLPSFSQLLDPGYLTSGLFSLEKLERYLRRHLPLNDFKKIENRLIITSVDLDRAERVLFGKGYDADTPISRAVAASCCIPGLFRPFEIRGRYHIDGEVARTLSADVAVEAGADIVIVSNIYRPAEGERTARSVARRGPLQVMNQSINIMLTEKERRGIDLYTHVHPRCTFIDIAPDIGRFGYLNRFAARSLVLRGYRAALQTLAAAKERGLFELPRVALGGPLN